MTMKCDKCGGVNIARFPKTPPKEPEPKLMSEVVKLSTTTQTTFDVYIRTHEVLLCHDCGYRIEFSY